MGLLALGVGVGLGIALFRNLPPMPSPSLVVVVFSLAVGLAAAWWGGKRHSQQQWQMQMQAQQQAQDQKQAQQQHVAVYVGEGGRAAAQAVVGPPTEAAHQLESSTARLGAGSSTPELLKGRSPATVPATRSQDTEPDKRVCWTPARMLHRYVTDTPAPEGEQITATGRGFSRDHLLQTEGGFLDVHEAKESPGLDALNDVSVATQVPVPRVVAALVESDELPSAIPTESDRDDSVRAD